MVKKIDPVHNWKKLSPSDGHYFFGYYDRNPWNHDITRHLVMKVPQIERLPERGSHTAAGINHDEIASENLLIPVTAGHVTARKAEIARKLAENALQKEKLSAILNT